ncbi:MAG: hypothetical protein GX168_03855 [Bacteroidales bacterium]|jgi:hypothetical protein|nr:hypothetical protein [Bacteroidales bacterium]
MEDHPMKKWNLLMIVLLMAGFAAGCSSKRQLSATDGLTGNEAQAAQDTLEYELLIIDPAFETWYLRYQRPESYYSLEYLENWNRQLVMQWNSMVMRPGRPDCMPSNFLDYDPSVSYGLTLNHKLYYYFRFTQQKCRIFNPFPRDW